jgi:hypothetical protein
LIRADSAVAAIVRFSDVRRAPPYLKFTRAELNRLLGLYATRVMRGEWRDYAISHEPGRARFCVFRNANDMPLYEIAKLGQGKARSASGDSRFVVTSQHQQLGHGHTLDDVLAVFDQRIRLIIV